MFKKISLPHMKKAAAVAVLFALCFLSGYKLAEFLHPESALPVSAEGNWGLSFQEEGKPPVANASADYLKQFDAYYAQDTDDKVIYLTFDAGYENGNTPAILDALKKHSAPAAFFLVGNYLETSPELVKRMVAEGHTVGNHTYHHPDMSKISTPETFSKELTDLEDLFYRSQGSPWKNTTGRRRENTAKPTCRWRRIWDTTRFSGVWLRGLVRGQTAGP